MGGRVENWGPTAWAPAGGPRGGQGSGRGLWHSEAFLQHSCGRLVPEGQCVRLWARLSPCEVGRTGRVERRSGP